MRFGDFLIQSGVISQHQLLIALGRQFQDQPFAPLVAVELGYLTSREAMRILDLGSKSEGGFLEVTAEKFLTAAQSEESLSDEQVSIIRRTLIQRRISIGNWLIATGAVEKERIPELLKRFLQYANLDAEHDRNASGDNAAN